MKYFHISSTLVMFLLTACNLSTNVIQTHTVTSTILVGKTMGTFWQIRAVNVNPNKINDLYNKIQAQLDCDDDMLSTYKNNSAIMKFNQFHDTAPWPVNSEVADIIIKSLLVGYKTNGAMDITIRPLVNLWGFGTDKQPLTTPNKAEIDAARIITGLRHLTVISKYGKQYLIKDIPDLSIDLSTLGEGYAADHLSTLMNREGVTNYLVSVGGALVSKGLNIASKPWRVAIQKPTDKHNIAQAIININGYSVSTSGSYRNYYNLNNKRISHIINPHTGYPIDNNLLSVTVVANTALEVDAWDTALMVLGLNKAKEVAQKEGLAVYIVFKKNNKFVTWISPQFKPFLIK